MPDFQLTDDVKVVKSFLDPSKQIELKDDDKSPSLPLSLSF